jgi:thiol-disulfide isomerase/thioredoxin
MRRWLVKIFINSKKHCHQILNCLIILCISLVITACEYKSVALVTAKDDHGTTIHFSDYKGKWIVLNYWASWCEYCQAEIPQLNAFYQAHAQKNAVVLAVNFDQVDNQKLRQMIKQLNIVYPVLASNPGPQMGITEIPGLPMSFLINPKGFLVKTLYGQQTKKSLEDKMGIGE